MPFLLLIQNQSKHTEYQLSRLVLIIFQCPAQDISTRRTSPALPFFKVPLAGNPINMDLLCTIWWWVAWLHLCESLSLTVRSFDCVDHNKLWKTPKEMGIPDHLTCLLRNLYASQDPTVRTGCGTMDLFKIGKGVWQGCILSPCLFNLYAEYIMWNARLEESKVGIKSLRRNSSNLRYADTTLMAES